MIRGPSFVAIVVLSAVSSDFAWGWGPEGHAIVAKIGSLRLTPKAKAEIAELLDGSEIFDESICTWADQIRTQEPKTAPWHFVDIPKDDSAFNEEAEGDGGNNVIDQLTYWRDLLATLTKTKKLENKADRLRALKFIVHLAGDLHQPLHCADNKDHGGNDVELFFLQGNMKTNLHKVWDTLLLQENMGNTGAVEYAKKLQRRIVIDYKQESVSWKDGTPEQWANESHALAKEYAYKLPTEKEVRLDQGYVDEGRRVVDLQLQKAGVRLAQILNEALK